MEKLVSKQIVISRKKLILFAEAINAKGVNKDKAEEVNKAEGVSKCGLFFKVAAGPRHYWLQHIASYNGPRRIFIAHIINTKSSYHFSNGSNPLLIRRTLNIVFLDLHQSTQTAIRGSVEVGVKKNGERNIDHNSNIFGCSTISYEEAKYYYMSRLEDCINYYSQPAEADTYQDIIDAALSYYIVENGLDLSLSEFPIPYR